MFLFFIIGRSFEVALNSGIKNVNRINYVCSLCVLKIWKIFYWLVEGMYFYNLIQSSICLMMNPLRLLLDGLKHQFKTFRTLINETIIYQTLMVLFL